MFPWQGTSERSIALVLRRREGEGFQQELMEHQLGQEGKFKWYSKTIFQATIKLIFFIQITAAFCQLKPWVSAFVHKNVGCGITRSN